MLLGKQDHPYLLVPQDRNIWGSSLLILTQKSSPNGNSNCLISAVARNILGQNTGSVAFYSIDITCIPLLLPTYRNLQALSPLHLQVSLLSLRRWFKSIGTSYLDAQIEAFPPQHKHLKFPNVINFIPNKNIFK